MQDDEFNYIAALIKQRSGLSLNRDKTYLLESRLQPIARMYECLDAAQLIRKLRTTPDHKILNEITEAMTTNESMFFRDLKPFQQFSDIVLPKLLEQNADSKRLRIWSAACSNGQEPYSLAISMQEKGAQLAGWQKEILASDLSNKVLDKARKGDYSQFEVQRGLPIQVLIKYFEQCAENHWRIRDAIRQMVDFRMFNLLDDFTPLGKFDVIFCRNVLIYFDEPTKSMVLSKLAQALNPGGFLFLGSAETIIGLTDKFRSYEQQRGVFVLNQPAEACVA